MADMSLLLDLVFLCYFCDFFAYIDLNVRYILKFYYIRYGVF